MKLPEHLVTGTRICRYKRFLADVTLDSGEIITVHCPNSGSMTGCAVPGSPVILSRSDRPGRKYPHTWELVQVGGCWIGTNTGITPALVREAVVNGIIPELQGYGTIRPEVRRGDSRLDLLLTGERGTCWVEVKNVTLADTGRALFPDAVTVRGQKHLTELMAVVRSGERGVIFFVVQRGDCQSMAPADRIDPRYGALLREAVAAGVEVLAYRAEVSPSGVALAVRLPVELDKTVTRDW
jgi:sugar fermentation stimulation protein A